MNTIKIEKNALGPAMAKAMEAYAVAGPAPDREGHLFRHLKPGEVPDLAYAGTRLSPKALLFPQADPMFCFKVPANQNTDRDAAPFIEAESAGERPLAVVGIRPYDARAFDLLKLNFDSKDYKDPFFLNRFTRMVRVGLADTTPGPANFSLSCGTGPFDTASLDILLADAGDAYIGTIVTAKGEAFAAAAGIAPGPPGITETLSRMQKEAEDRIAPAPDLSAALSTDTLDLYEQEHWEPLAFSCINCGACTFACPTCWCFDIQDEVRRNEGVRLRLWDTCMTGLYSAHASGHNPRQEGFKRFRNRFMHKLKYFPDKYGQGIMCVGCGRCIESCPAGIDIRNIMAAMNSRAARTREVAS